MSTVPMVDKLDPLSSNDRDQRSSVLGFLTSWYTHRFKAYSPKDAQELVSNPASTYTQTRRSTLT
jgi:hypothetical protein